MRSVCDGFRRILVANVAFCNYYFMINDRLSRDNTHAWFMVCLVVVELFIYLPGSHTLKTYGNTWLLKGDSHVSGIWVMNN